jgi:hypothetical protein
MLLYLDTETVPSTEPALIASIEAKHVVTDDVPPPPEKSQIKAAANLKDEQKIADDIDKRYAKAVADREQDVIKLAERRVKAAAALEEEIAGLALKAETAQIATMSWAFDDGAVMREPAACYDTGEKRADGSPVVGFSTMREADALKSFFAAADAAVTMADTRALPNAATNFTSPTGSAVVPIVVAHNVFFDVHMIRKRAIILGVAVPAWWPWDARPWDQKRIQDTQFMWGGAQDRISLSRLCGCLSVPGKGDIDGSKVWAAIKAGRLAEVIEYCDDDVLRLRCVHRRIRGLPTLKVDVAILRRDYSDITAAEMAAAGYSPPAAEGAAA